MTSSETPGTISRVILGAIVAALAIAIATGLFSGIADGGLSRERADLRDFVNGVNSVCNGQQSATSPLTNLEDYYINRSDEEKKVHLVNPSEEIVDTKEVECHIDNEFKVSNSYKVDLREEGNKETYVEVSGGQYSSQGGEDE
ncbi:MAG: hypothetical protein BRC28_01610 [Nanohaloarchaea archaeon SW_4_43_9]|nr:MAG: hypothetical protein BRC28_01610 [Nanohaloarchaea archaeon SW_4_43_9]